MTKASVIHSCLTVSRPLTMVTHSSSVNSFAFSSAFAYAMLPCKIYQNHSTLFLSMYEFNIYECSAFPVYYMVEKWYGKIHETLLSTQLYENFLSLSFMFTVMWCNAAMNWCLKYEWILSIQLYLEWEYQVCEKKLKTIKLQDRHKWYELNLSMWAWNRKWKSRFGILP